MASRNWAVPRSNKGNGCGASIHRETTRIRSAIIIKVVLRCLCWERDVVYNQHLCLRYECQKKFDRLKDGILKRFKAKAKLRKVAGLEKISEAEL